MKAIGFLFLAMVCLVTAGCGGGALGPVTAGNIVNDYPPKIRSVVVNLEASMVTVSYQPYDGDVRLESWFIQTGENSNQRQLQFKQAMTDGFDNTSGRAVFVLDSGTPLMPGVTYFFKITVQDPASWDGSFEQRTRQEIWQFKDGATSQIS